jgi:hypothetical protein
MTPEGAKGRKRAHHCERQRWARGGMGKIHPQGSKSPGMSKGWGDETFSPCILNYEFIQFDRPGQRRPGQGCWGKVGYQTWALENGGEYPPLTLQGSRSPCLKKGGEGGVKRFRHVVSKKYLDKFWIKWGFGSRRAENFWN